MGSPTRYAYCEKEMLGWIHEKMATLKSAPRGGKFSTYGSITVGNDTLTCNDSCAPSEDAQLLLGIVLGTMHIHPTRLAKVRDWAKSQVL